MSDFAARIGRVRMKSGGADVRVLRTPVQPYEEEETYRGAMMRNARAVIETDKVLAGYLVLGIFDDSSVSLGWRYNYESERAIPRMLLPSWLAEVLRRDLISNDEARDVFNEMFEWQEG